MNVLLIHIENHGIGRLGRYHLADATSQRKLGVSFNSRNPDFENVPTSQTRNAPATLLLNKDGLAFWLLAACFAIALGVHINARVFFSDEIATLYVAQGSFAHTIREVVHDVHPPLYFVVAHVFVQLFPPEGLRLLSALCAFLAFFVVRRLASVLLLNRSAHFPFLVLFASSPFIIFVSRMARYYSMTLLLAMAATYCLLFYMREQKRVWCVLYFFALLALVYTNYLTIVLLVAHIVYILLARHLPKASRRALAIAFLATGLCYIPWLVVLAHQYQGIIASEGYHFSFVQGIKKGILNTSYLLYCFALGDSIAPWNVLRAALFLLPWIVAVVLSARSCKPWHHLRSCPAFLFLILLLVAAVLLLFIAFQQMNLIYVPMRVAFLSPFFLLVVAEAFPRLGKAQETALLLALLLVNGFSLANYYSNRETTNWAYNIPVHDILTMIDRLHTPDTLTVVDNYNFNREFNYYKPRGAVQGLKEQNLSADALKKLFRPFPRVLFLYATHDGSPDKKVASMQAFLQDYYKRRLRIRYIEEDAHVRNIKELIVGRDVQPFKIHLDLFERDELSIVPD